MDDAITARIVTAILDFEVDARPETVAAMGSKHNMLELVGVGKPCVANKAHGEIRYLAFVCLAAYAGVNLGVRIVINVNRASRHDERHVSRSK